MPVANLLAAMFRIPARTQGGLSEGDRAVIRAYAALEEGGRTGGEAGRVLFASALAIHRGTASLPGAQDTPERRFMVEVDSPVVDLLLRVRRRRELLGSGEDSAAAR